MGKKKVPKRGRDRIPRADRDPVICICSRCRRFFTAFREDARLCGRADCAEPPAPVGPVGRKWPGGPA